MSDKNQVSVFGGNVALDTSTIARGVTQALDQAPSGGGNYMNFSGKSGHLTYGADKGPVPADELFILNIADIGVGWICWKGGSVAAKRIAPSHRPPVPTPDMNEFGPFKESEGWSELYVLQFKSLEDGEQYELGNSAYHGRRQIAGLLEKVAEQANKGEGCWPVVTISSTEAPSKQYRNYMPVFNVVGWLTDEQLPEAFDPDSDLDTLLSGNPSGGETKAPKEEEKPRRRRRAASL